MEASIEVVHFMAYQIALEAAPALRMEQLYLVDLQINPNAVFSASPDQLTAVSVRYKTDAKWRESTITTSNLLMNHRLNYPQLKKGFIRAVHALDL